MQWSLKSADQTQIAVLAKALQADTALNLQSDSRLAAILARLLVMRGIADPESAARFLAPSLAHLHSPYAIAGMSRVLRHLAATGSLAGIEDGLASFAERQRLVDYDGFVALDRRYAESADREK